MTESPNKDRSTRKKRSRHEKRAHENKKRKRNKKIVRESTIEQVESVKSSQVVISDDFSLSSFRTMIISSYVFIFERMMTFIVRQQEDIRARELFETLEKTRQKYLIERMKKIIHSSSYRSDDESFVHEKVTFFISVNSQSQIHYPTSATRALTIENQKNQILSPILIYTTFYLEEFLSELEKALFAKDNSIEKNILIEQVKADLESKRLVLASFNEESAIMR